MNSTNKSYNLLLLATALLFTTNILSATTEPYEPATPQEKPSWFSSSWLGKKWAERKKRKRAEHLATRDEKVEATRQKLATRMTHADAKKLIVAKEVYKAIEDDIKNCYLSIQRRFNKSNLYTISKLGKEGIARYLNRIFEHIKALEYELKLQLGTITWYLNSHEFNSSNNNIRFFTPEEIEAQAIRDNENRMLSIDERSKEQQTSTEMQTTSTTREPSDLEYQDGARFSGRSTPTFSEHDGFSSSPTSSTTSSLRQPEQPVSIRQTTTAARPTIRGAATALNVRQRLEADKLAREKRIQEKEREQARKAATSQIIDVDTSDIRRMSRSNSANRLNTPPMDPFNISSRGVMPLSLQQSPTDQVRWVQPTS